jgi:hypothetical protein
MSKWSDEEDSAPMRRRPDGGYVKEVTSYDADQDVDYANR